MAWTRPPCLLLRMGLGAVGTLTDSSLLLVGLRLIKSVTTGRGAETCHGPRALWGCYLLRDAFFFFHFFFVLKTRNGDSETAGELSEVTKLP